MNTFREVILVYFENDTFHINAVYGKIATFFNITSRGTYSYHRVLIS